MVGAFYTYPCAHPNRRLERCNYQNKHNKDEDNLQPEKILIKPSILYDAASIVNAIKNLRERLEKNRVLSTNAWGSLSSDHFSKNVKIKFNFKAEIYKLPTEHWMALFQGQWTDVQEKFSSVTETSKNQPNCSTKSFKSRNRAREEKVEIIEEVIEAIPVADELDEKHNEPNEASELAPTKSASAQKTSEQTRMTVKRQSSRA